MARLSCTSLTFAERKQLGRCPVNRVKTSHSSWTPPLSHAINRFSAFSSAYPIKQEIVAITKYAIPPGADYGGEDRESYGEVGVRILFMPESTEGVSEGQTTAMSGENR